MIMWFAHKSRSAEGMRVEDMGRIGWGNYKSICISSKERDDSYLNQNK